MINKYYPANFYMLPARGNVKSLGDAQLYEAIIRADLYQRFDFWACTVYFYSNNQKEPLTEEEKYLLRNRLVSTMPRLNVVFEDGKYPLDITPIEDTPNWPKEGPV